MIAGFDAHIQSGAAIALWHPRRLLWYLDWDEGIQAATQVCDADPRGAPRSQSAELVAAMGGVDSALNQSAECGRSDTTP